MAAHSIAHGAHVIQHISQVPLVITSEFRRMIYSGGFIIDSHQAETMVQGTGESIECSEILLP